MRKFILVIISILMIALFSSCGGEYSPEEKNPLANKTFPQFKTKDIYGNDVNEKIFADNTITMINIWGTFCSPCIKEMPDLQKLYEDNKDKKFNIVGIISDGGNNETNEEASKIISEAGVKYLNIIPDHILSKEIVNQFNYVPVSLFVNSESTIIETFTPGSKSLEQYQKTIDSLLEK